MTEFEFCKVCGSLKPADGQCDVCYNRMYEDIKALIDEEIREEYERVQKSGGPKKKSKSK